MDDMICKIECPMCKEKKTISEYTPKGSKCRDCQNKYYKSLKDKNPLIKWGRNNLVPSFAFNPKPKEPL